MRWVAAHSSWVRACRVIKWRGKWALGCCWGLPSQPHPAGKYWNCCGSRHSYCPSLPVLLTSATHWAIDCLWLGQWPLWDCVHCAACAWHPSCFLLHSQRDGMWDMGTTESWVESTWSHLLTDEEVPREGWAGCPRAQSNSGYLLPSWFYSSRGWEAQLARSSNFFFFLIFILNRRIIALQCCVGVCCPTVSYKYTYILSLWASSHPPASHLSRSSQSTELSSLCYKLLPTGCLFYTW